MKYLKAADVWVTVGLGLLVWLFAAQGKLHFEDIQYSNETGQAKAVTIPFNEPSPNNDGHYVITGKLILGKLAPRVMNIIADDTFHALQINGQEVDLGLIQQGSLHDWSRGFVIDLESYLQPGENLIKATISDHGGGFGLKISPDMDHIRALMPVLSLAAFMAALMLCIGRRVGLAGWLIPALILGVVLRIVYLSATPFDERTHDVWAHLEYIQHFVNNWSLPPLDNAQGGAYFHPPFYYFVAAIFQTLVTPLVGNTQPAIHLALQWLSNATGMACLLFGLLIVQRTSAYFTGNGDARSERLKFAAFGVAGLIVACWPSLIIHSIRISNDAFLYVFFTAALYFLIRWHDDRSWRSLWWASLFAALATASKANGVVLLPIAACTLLCAWGQNRFAFSGVVLKRVALLAIAPLIGTAIAFYPGVALKLEGKRTHTYVSNINNVGADQIVGNEAQNLLWFDTKMFVTEPFTSPWDDKMGRQYFGNYLGKTGLFGEWRYDGGLARNSAVVMSVCYLLMSLLILYGFYRMPLKPWRQLAPQIFTVIFLLAAISHMRMSFPVNVDFRYILPIVICYGSFLAGATSVFLDTGKRRLAAVSVLTQLIFLVSSVIFVWGVIADN